MRLTAFVLGLCLSSVASAEVRLFNGTGKELHFDLLHEDHQLRDQVLPADRAISEVFGVPLERNEGQMLVVRDSAGKELLRERVASDKIHALAMWGDSLSVEAMAYYKGDNSDPPSIVLVNSTGRELHVKAERHDFSLIEDKTPGPRHSQAVVFYTFSNVAKEKGTKKKIDIWGVGVERKTHELEAGGVYHIAKGGALTRVK